MLLRCSRRSAARCAVRGQPAATGSAVCSWCCVGFETRLCVCVTRSQSAVSWQAGLGICVCVTMTVPTRYRLAISSVRGHGTLFKLRSSCESAAGGCSSCVFQLCVCEITVWSGLPVLVNVKLKDGSYGVKWQPCADGVNAQDLLQAWARAGPSARRL